MPNTRHPRHTSGAAHVGRLARAGGIPLGATAERISHTDRVAALYVVAPGCTVSSRAITSTGCTGVEAAGAKAGRLARADIVPLNVAAEWVRRTR